VAIGDVASVALQWQATSVEAAPFGPWCDQIAHAVLTGY